MAGSIEQQLYDLAEDNYGYVTTRMAAAASIPAHRLVQLAERGALERVSRGVYRLVRFPPSPLDSYMAATLWPSGLQGVLCHDTALDLYDVCDINPHRVHIAVPRSHRVRRAVPKQYVIHHVDLEAIEISAVGGIPVTKLLRTIADCVAAGVGTYLLEQAVANGTSRGLLLSREARIATELISPRKSGGAQ
ncbi:MAG: type IV toxin-antitoxin system AbiEi family antitoxin domain-containing protein [Thermoleophilia bacterium]|nr:type IV toxin-antitoxin system AbiEi family antitoxin domain-containing protein [Thermoleophilia bacterium]